MHNASTLGQREAAVHIATAVIVAWIGGAVAASLRGHPVVGAVAGLLIHELVAPAVNRQLRTLIA